MTDSKDIVNIETGENQPDVMTRCSKEFVMGSKNIKRMMDKNKPTTISANLCIPRTTLLREMIEIQKKMKMNAKVKLKRYLGQDKSKLLMVRYVEATDYRSSAKYKIVIDIALEPMACVDGREYSLLHLV